MRLIGCHVENFGCLQDLDVQFDPGQSVIYEENGWGKSTLAVFLRVMFYGFENDGKKDETVNERRRYLPWQKGVYGGWVIFETGGREYRLERIFGSKKSGSDSIELYDQRTNLRQDLSELDIPGGNIGSFLFGIGSRSFQRTVFIGQQDCASADATAEINAKIGNVSDQTADMGNYEKVRSDLEKELNRLSPKRKTGRINRLMMEAADLEEKARQREGRNHELEQNEQEIDELKKRRKQLQAEQKKISEQIQKFSADREMALLEEKYRNLLKAEKDAENRLAQEQAGFAGTIPSAEQIDELIEKVRSSDKLRASLESRRDQAEMLRVMAASENYPEDEKEGASPLILPIFAGIAAFIGFTLLLLKFWAGGILAFVCGILLIVFWFYLKRGKEPDYVMPSVEVDGYRAVEVKYEKIMRSIDEDEKAADDAEMTARDFLVRMGWTEDPLVLEDLEKELQEMRRKVINIQGLWKEFQEKESSREQFEKDNNIEALQRHLQTKNAEAAASAGTGAGSDASLQDLTAELDQIPGEIDELSDRIHELEIGAASALQEIEQGEGAEEELIRLREEIRKAQHRYDVISRTKEYLEQAKIDFSARYMEPIRDSFNHYYAMISGGDQTAYELDAELNIRVREAGSLHDTELLSEGYRDLVGLCRRMAMIDAMYEREKPFLIFDDPFVNLDDRRLEGALRFLDRISNDYQVIYFTCSESRVPED